ncbi:DPP IV N-terminal domain-containing protein [Maribacter litopenaei]|uniref:DPP IV N-terminal domain-containing protein n=1 Tax=Maribacter litopenaei TaxID=2976127 RepID=A0ABY5Y4I1_9FLAO|nr:DPP IV N-terminal domain-containing protein [Maribacter litopenaei]UWX53779.1 DPP IV N-terminal domain-containing protein [Maribacter litopenaei]
MAFNMFVPGKDESLIKMPAKPEGAKWNTPPTYIDKMNYRGDGQGYLKAGNDQLFTLSINGGTPKQLTTAEFDHGAPVWSNDGKSLYFSANFHPEEDFEPANSEVYKLDLSNNSVTPLTSRFGPDGSPALSPDGKKIAYTGYDDTFQGYQVEELYVMNADGSNSQLISRRF